MQNVYRKTEQLLKLFPQLKDKELIEKITQAVQTIQSEELQELVRLKYFENYSLEEISRIHGVSYRATSKRKMTAIKLITQELFPDELARMLMKNEV